MKHRAFLLVTGSLLAGSGVFGLACSSSAPPFTGDDAGLDGSLDALKPDTSTPDSSKPDGADGGGPGCTDNIPGPCDLVAQDCPSGNECVSIGTADGGDITACQPNGGGALKKGTACTGGGSNPCVAGTTCISGRCAPACCNGNDSICGDSIPEGFTGLCNISIVDKNAKSLYFACTYNAACKPFGVQPCPNDYACLIKDQSGTATCTTIFQPPGVAENQPCTSANSCKDGMMCLSTGDAGSLCTYVCYKGNGPFDAGISSAPSGKGGCSLLKKTCGGGITGMPSWLGICQ